MIYHDEYIVESFSTTTKQSYNILLGDFQKGKTRRGLSQINNALRLYLRNQRVVGTVWSYLFYIFKCMLFIKLYITSPWHSTFGSHYFMYISAFFFFPTILAQGYTSLWKSVMHVLEKGKVKTWGSLVLQLVYHQRPQSSKKYPKQGFFFGVKWHPNENIGMISNLKQVFLVMFYFGIIFFY